MRAILTIIVALLFYPFSASSFPSPVTVSTFNTQSDDLYDKCLSINQPTLYLPTPGSTTLNSSVNSGAALSPVDHCGAYTFSPFSSGDREDIWYSSAMFLNAPRVNLSTLDGTTANFINDWGSPINTSYSQIGRFCLKYFGVPSDGDWAYSNCQDISISFDSQGINGAVRGHRQGYNYWNSIGFSRNSGQDAVNTTYSVNGYWCKGTIDVNAYGGQACHLLSVAYDDGMLININTHWRDWGNWPRWYYTQAGSPVNFGFGDIAVGTTSTADSSYTMPSNAGKNYPAIGTAVCAVRIPVGSRYPVTLMAATNNTNMPQKFGINYNLAFQEDYNSATQYAVGQRNEICAFLTESMSSVGASGDTPNSCASPYKTPYVSGGSTYQYYVAASFIGCVQEPLNPFPPTLNPTLIASVAPTLTTVYNSASASTSATSNFYTTSVLVTNGLNISSANITNESITLSASYAALPNTTTPSTAQCQSLLTGIDNTTTFSDPNCTASSSGGSSNTCNLICAVIPEEDPSNVCICYLNECANGQYIKCNGANSRPALNPWQYQLQAVFDPTYGYGIAIMLVTPSSISTPQSSLTAADFMPAVTNNTIYEVIYQNQAQFLNAQREPFDDDSSGSSGSSSSSSSGSSNSSAAPAAATSAIYGFINDTLDKSIFYGLDSLTSVIPYIPNGTAPANYMSSIVYQNLYTPQGPSPAISDPSKSCFRYAPVPSSPPAAYTNYTSYIVPGGLRHRASDVFISANQGLENALSPNVTICPTGGCSNSTPGIIQYSNPTGGGYITTNYCRGVTSLSPGTISQNINCPIPLEIDNTNTYDPAQCRHNEATPAGSPPAPSDNIRPSQLGALEIVNPGIFIAPSTDDIQSPNNMQICLFTNSPTSYYLLTGITQPTTPAPYVLACTNMPPISNCNAVTTPTASSSYLTWAALSSNAAESANCPTANSPQSYTAANGTITTYIAEPAKNYYFSIPAQCGASNNPAQCLTDLQTIQYTLQQGYQTFCKNNPTQNTNGSFNTDGIGGIDTGGKLIPDCHMGLDTATYNEVINLIATFNSNYLPASGSPAYYVTLTNLFTEAINGTYPATDPVFGMLDNYNGNAIVSYGDQYAGASGSESVPLPTKTFYVLKFQYCDTQNTTSNLLNCHFNTFMAQKYLYTFLAQKQSGRNLTFAEEQIVRFAFLDQLSAGGNPWNGTLPVLNSSLTNYGSNIQFNADAVINITRQCDNNRVSYTNSCAINPMIDMCPPIGYDNSGNQITATNVHPEISGNAYWQGFNFWSVLPQANDVNGNPVNYLFYTKQNFNAYLNNNASLTNYLGMDLSAVPNYQFSLSSYGPNPAPSASGGYLFTPGQTINNAWAQAYGFNTYSSDLNNVNNANATYTSPLYKMLTGMNFMAMTTTYYNENALKVGYKDYPVTGSCINGTAGTPTRACRVYYIGTADHVNSASNPDTQVKVLGAHWLPVTSACQ
jgi:hypothetical protein